jgi:hypothetical protein
VSYLQPKVSNGRYFFSVLGETKVVVYAATLRMKRLKLVTVILSVLMMGLWACQKKSYVCPAYQSAFILDKKKADKTFRTKMGPDSMPLDEQKQLKNQYLLATYIPKKEKQKQQAIVLAETQFMAMGHTDSIRKGYLIDSAAIFTDSLRRKAIRDYIKTEEEEEQKINDREDPDTILISEPQMLLEVKPEPVIGAPVDAQPGTLSIPAPNKANTDSVVEFGLPAPSTTPPKRKAAPRRRKPVR